MNHQPQPQPNQQPQPQPNQQPQPDPIWDLVELEFQEAMEMM